MNAILEMIRLYVDAYGEYPKKLVVSEAVFEKLAAEFNEKCAYRVDVDGSDSGYEIDGVLIQWSR